VVPQQPPTADEDECDEPAPIMPWSGQPPLRCLRRHGHRGPHRNGTTEWRPSGHWSRGHWISPAEAAWDNAGAGQQPDDEDELLCIHGKPFFQHDGCDDKIVFRASGDTTGGDE
jgi:hypothetical protein